MKAFDPKLSSAPRLRLLGQARIIATVPPRSKRSKWTQRHLVHKPRLPLRTLVAAVRFNIELVEADQSRDADGSTRPLELFNVLLEVFRSPIVIRDRNRIYSAHEAMM